MLLIPTLLIALPAATMAANSTVRPSVDQLLTGLGMQQHASAFDAVGVQWDDLQDLQSNDLQELGLTLPERLRLLRAVRKQRQATPIAGSCAPGMPVCQDFIFQLANYNSTRQKGKTLNFIIKYRYPAGAGSQAYIEYNNMRSVVLYYAEPTSDLPRDVYWELVNMALCKNLTAQFSLNAVRRFCCTI